MENKILLSKPLSQLKDEMVRLMLIVKRQNEDALKALINRDKSLALEVVQMEKSVNRKELSLEAKCERILALYKPVAGDLRQLIAILKINYYTETIGNIAEDIAIFFLEVDRIPKKMLSRLNLYEMHNITMEMFDICINSLNDLDHLELKNIFLKDPIVNTIYRKFPKKYKKILKKNSLNLKDDVNFTISLSTLFSKIEKIGDFCKNIAEEIIFCVDSQNLRHEAKKTKLEFLEKVIADKNNSDTTLEETK